MTPTARNRLLSGVLLLFLALGLRLPGLGNPPTDIHHVRQSESASIARNMARSGLELTQPRVDWLGAHGELAESGLPLYELLCALGWRSAVRLTEVHYAWARGLSVAGWLLGGLALFLWVRRRLPGPPILYLALYLFSPLALVFSRNIQPDALALGLLLLGLERCDASCDGPGRKALLLLVAGALVCGLGVSMDGNLLFFLPLVALLGAGLGSRDRGELRWLRGVLAGLVAAAGPVLWYALMASRLGDGGLVSSLFGRGDSPWGGPEHWFSLAAWRAVGGVLVVQAITPVGLPALAFGLAGLPRSRALRPFALALALFLLGMVVLTGSYQLRNFELLGVLPFVSVLAGAGLHSWWIGETPLSRRNGQALGGLALLLSLVLGTLFVHGALQRDLRIERLGLSLASTVLKGSPIVVSDRHPQTLLFMMNRRGWQRREMSLAEVDVLERSGARFLLVTSSSPSYADPVFLGQLLEARRLAARSRGWILVGLRGTGRGGGVSGVPVLWGDNAPRPDLRGAEPQPVSPGTDTATDPGEEEGSKPRETGKGPVD
ncbi:MAG: hypothetical protein VX498_09000 [Myxococcota bacterium]|nr:hypothetical protein [Myxococcota bacterium]